MTALTPAELRAERAASLARQVEKEAALPSVPRPSPKHWATIQGLGKKGRRDSAGPDDYLPPRNR